MVVSCGWIASSPKTFCEEGRGRMGKCGRAVASDCWCGREVRNQALSRRALVIVCSFLLLATIEPKEAADLANESDVLLEMKKGWRNPPELSSWSTDTSACDGWLGVTCDVLNTTIKYLELSFIVDSEIPTIIGNLTNLTRISFFSCNLVGEIPRTVGSLKNLQWLNLGNNGLNGSIPAELGELTTLTSLTLSGNNLTGILPDLSLLQSLEYLDLGRNNELTGPVPSWIGGLSQLQGLTLLFTNFTGSVPPQLGNLTSLVTLNLESCGLSGLLPPELGNLKSLFKMQMDSNEFTGSIPDSFRNLQSLTSLILNDNRLNGSIGSWIGDLHSLTEMALDDNLIEGPIPPELGTLLNLTKITASNNQLNGEIPASFGNLTSLAMLALDNNRISGPVPSSILSLPDLVFLTLDDNCLNGSTPVNQSNSNLQPSYNGNCFNDSSISQPCKCVAAVALSPDIPLIVNGGSSSNSNSKIYISVGVVMGALLALAVFIMIYLRCRRPHKELTPPGAVRCYRLSEIKEATNNFTTKIGKGGQATVYKAELKDGVAAIKRFGHDVEPSSRRRAVKTFGQEVSLLARLNHRFLVNLTGYCQESGEYMLLFEYMDKGSLYDHLHGIFAAESSITWEERVVILICVASGIDYLHYGCFPPVFHRDIKSANILLSSEQKLMAKVADFGLGKMTTIDPQGDDVDFTAGTPKPDATAVMGSHGYIDTNFLRTAVYSEKSDIYSYGVVLLELITGRKALAMDNVLTEWVTPYLDEPNEILQVVDPKMDGNFVEEELLAVAEIARSCIDPRPSNRPTIRNIIQKLRTLFRKQATIISPSERTTSSGVDYSENQSSLSGEVPNYSVNSYGQSELLPRD